MQSALEAWEAGGGNAGHPHAAGAGSAGAGAGSPGAAAASGSTVRGEDEGVRVRYATAETFTRGKFYCPSCELKIARGNGMPCAQCGRVMHKTSDCMTRTAGTNLCKKCSKG